MTTLLHKLVAQAAALVGAVADTVAGAAAADTVAVADTVAAAGPAAVPVPPPPPPPPPPPAPPPPPPPLARSSAPAARGGGAITPAALRARKANLRPADGFAPPVAFSFRVVFGAAQLKGETAFQEVSGIGARMETEAVAEGGENRYQQHLPAGVRFEPLVLKRSIGAASSNLVAWCRVTLEGGLGQQIRTMPLTVYLLDPQGEPLRAWLFADAYPVEWEVAPFDANRNEVALETVKLRYTFCNRIL